MRIPSSFLTATIVLCVGLDVTAAASRPNFLVIVADDVSWDCFGCTGSAHARTPHVDRLASEGLRLDNMYVAVSQCAPARAELYTGLYPHHNGVLANATRRDVPGVENVVDHLTPLGYKVGLTGKLHFNRGKLKFAKIPGFPPGCNSSIADYSLDGVKSFINGAREQEAPFCVFICSIHAHHPWDLGTQAHFPPNVMQLPPHFIESPLAREAIARHAAEVEELDRQVGDAMAMLDEMRLSDDTVVLFVSEQGIAMPRGKWTIYNYGSRALGIVRWPGKIAPRVTTAVTQYCDVVPTLVELAGGLPTGLDGRSMRALWLGETDTHREVAYLSNTHPVWQRSIVSADYKLVWNPVRDGTYIFGNFSSPSKFFSKPWGEWQTLAESNDKAKTKVQRILRPAEVELYHISEDPYELENLAATPEHSARAQAMLAQLKRYMADVGDAAEPGNAGGSGRQKTPRQRGK